MDPPPPGVFARPTGRASRPSAQAQPLGRELRDNPCLSVFTPEQLASHNFSCPEKRIHDARTDMPKFEASPAYTAYIGFIVMLNEACKGVETAAEPTTDLGRQNVFFLLNS